MKHKLLIVVAAVAALVLLGAGLAGASQSEEPSPQPVRPADNALPGGLAGQVVWVGDASLTIKTRNDEVTVLVTDETKIFVPGIQDATLADIEVGAVVLIRTGSDQDDGLTATGIVVRPPRQLRENFVRGIVTALNGEEIEVETKEGESAILFTNDATRLWKPGEPLTTTLSLNIGDPLLAIGSPASAETDAKGLTAQLLVVVSDEDLPKVVIRGKVVTTTQQTIVVQAGRGERAITVLPRSRLQSARGRLESLRDIPQGAQIIALGQPTEMGQWIAGLVLVPGPQPLARNGLRGEVLAKDPEAGTLTVKTDQRGEITVATNTETRYRVPGIEEPGFDDIQVGDRVVVIGRFEEGDEMLFLARGIGVQPPGGGEESP